MRVVLCESCGAPLDAPWNELVIVCGSCGVHNLPGEKGDAVPLRSPVDGRPRVNLGGRTYQVESRLGHGDSSVVYRARWVVRLGELVVLKVLHNAHDADLMRREWRILQALSASRVRGASHFVSRLPRPVAHGLVTTDRPRVASVFGWQSGFVHTAHEVGTTHASGVTGEQSVWVLKRLLETLGFVHRSGFVHGAVTPDHILIHPYDHGANLIGWTVATEWTGSARPLIAKSRVWEAVYAGATEATPTLDIQMACRCVRQLAGWHLPDGIVPDPVRTVVDEGIAGRATDAWALAERLSAASREAFGPPGYHPLDMPGWSR